MGNGNDMNIIKFVESFPDENSCMKYFRHIREKEGIVCKKCGSNKQPSGSGNVLNAVSGQPFAVDNDGERQASHPEMVFSDDFYGFSKKGISTAEMQRQLDHTVTKQFGL